MTHKDMLNDLKIADLAIEFRHSKKRLLLLDYDGTLVDIENLPEKVIPSQKLLDCLNQLSSDSRTNIAIVSGRDQFYLSKYFDQMNLYLFAEHGSLFKVPGGNWESIRKVNSNWKEEIIPLLKLFTQMNKGSFMEEKRSTVAWHYRNMNPDDSFEVVKELKQNLKKKIQPEMNLVVMDGKKVIEVKQSGLDKGAACQRMLELEVFQFILAIGDDVTDEDMFRVLPPYAHSIKVGYSPTMAKMKVENTREVIRLLETLN